ncbi:CYTH and CHAD domain-containing protein [Desulfopila aestuarii]|uniref:CHAD domain-containing protein n=1 Tax=Desulfopila aestuarii DSM 18488 TaxID=1121416 RepID=A0A1M7YDE7_9BACT|nr:CHAD domain-containing protein [Desulfopila aestuarii]SHO50538.1 CHAD domain-containing protein [Desulfopila aestuarii DSM 18488]
MNGGQPFLIPRQLDVADLLASTGELFTVQESGEESFKGIYYDTFDWRLFAADLRFSRRGRLYFLQNRLGDSLVEAGVGPRRKKLFWWDFPEGELRNLLLPVVEQRALLPQFTLAGRMRRVNLLNKDEKTVVRLVFQEITGQAQEQRFILEPIVLVEPLRGYEKQLQQVRRLLEDAGLSEITDGYDPVAMAQTALSIDPRDTSSKFSVELAYGETVAEAVRDICLHLRSTMLLNVSGTLEDIDSEFLHDLRVSVRRTRSLLSLMKKQLPVEGVKHFQAEFKWLGNVTGPVRDLDVYLLKEQEYRDLLPEELQAGLTLFFKDLSRRRKRALKKLRVHLRSARFIKLLQNWEVFLRGLPEQPDYPQGKRRCRSVADAIISKRMNRILRQGQAITAETPDEMLHELRIEGKKFRYLLEFFRSLFERDAVDEYLKHMKKLQNTLGDFNDLAVQKDMLSRQLQNLEPITRTRLATAAALGGLIVQLHTHQRQVRGRFEETFNAFASEENVQLMEKILAGIDEESSVEN